MLTAEDSSATRPSSYSATTSSPTASRPRRGLPRDEPDALILLTPVEDPQSYGVAELDGEADRAADREAERPALEPRPGRRLPLRPAIFDAARALEPSWRGELEITEAIQGLIDDGRRVQSEVVKGWWKDTGQLADMLDANRLVLEEIAAICGRGRRESKVEGRVVLEEGATLAARSSAARR